MSESDELSTLIGLIYGAALAGSARRHSIIEVVELSGIDCLPERPRSRRFLVPMLALTDLRTDVP